MLSLALQDWIISVLMDLAFEDRPTGQGWMPQELGTVLNSALNL